VNEGQPASTDHPIVVDVLGERDPVRVRAEIRSGLLRVPPETNPKYFYDDRGSELFDAICELPEYYPTRTERTLLEEIADGIASRTRAEEIVELGSGSAQKTRILLDAVSRRGRLRLFVPFEFSEGTVRRVAGDLVREYPGLRVHAVVGDFAEQMDALPEAVHPRLILFLGGTIGNFRPPEARIFLEALAARMQPGEYFLLGTDLVKDVARLEAAYDDQAGVTAEFNRNVLRVLNHTLGANFVPEEFDHRAFYDRTHQWIEMRLVSRSDQWVRLPQIDLELHFEPGDEIRTEISAKFDRPRVETMLASCGFELLEWHTDPENQFALALSRRT
jgi:L-histidine Nalpha-methyltransferase